MPSPCTPFDGKRLTRRRPSTCRGYNPGHAIHPIHANHVGRSPWGWRDATVTAHNPDRTITVAYTGPETGTPRLWHHRGLHGIVPIGGHVRVHEGLYVLECSLGWLNVELTGGIGRIPEPAEPSTWATNMTVAVTDVAAGHAIPVTPRRSSERKRP